LEELWLYSCREIENLNFIRQLKNLKSFTFTDTNVLDDNLGPCNGI